MVLDLPTFGYPTSPTTSFAGAAVVAVAKATTRRVSNARMNELRGSTDWIDRAPSSGRVLRAPTPRARVFAGRLPRPRLCRRADDVHRLRHRLRQRCSRLGAGLLLRASRPGNEIHVTLGGPCLLRLRLWVHRYPRHRLRLRLLRPCLAGHRVHWPPLLRDAWLPVVPWRWQLRRMHIVSPPSRNSRPIHVLAGTQ